MRGDNEIVAAGARGIAALPKCGFGFFRRAQRKQRLVAVARESYEQTRMRILQEEVRVDLF
jgi:hypothetical protein